MGRQIRFFTMNNDEDYFIQTIFNSSDKIVDSKGNSMTLGEIKLCRLNLYIISPNSKIFYTKNNFINSINSDVIEYARNTVNIKKQVEYGRLWLETKYYDTYGNAVTKEKWLSAKFSKYKKWIVKNYRLSKDKDFYISEEAYKLYKSGEYKMMATPVTEVHFD